MIVLPESQRRLYEKLHHDLGERITSLLMDNDVNEIMGNPDGKLWIDSSTKGLTYLNDLPRTQAFSIINVIAGIHHFVVTQHSPRLEAELPMYRSMRGERFTAQIPPIVSAASFTIRKKSYIIFTLDDYINTCRLTQKQANVLTGLIEKRENILVCGGPERTNFSKTIKIVTTIAIGLFVLSGCQSEKTIQVPINSECSLRVNQEPSTVKQPAKFYLCDNTSYPCSTATYRWSGEAKVQPKKPCKHIRVKKRQKNKLALLTIKSRKKTHEHRAEKNNCVVK